MNIWINPKDLILGRRLYWNMIGCWGLGIFLTGGLCHFFNTSRLYIRQVALILIFFTQTVMFANHKCGRPRQILYIRLKLLKLCCHEIVINSSFKMWGSEVQSFDLLYLQLIEVEVNIRDSRVPWPFTIIHFVKSLYQFVCIRPNVWLGGLIYIKLVYIIALSLRISWRYRLVC